MCVIPSFGILYPAQIHKKHTYFLYKETLVIIKTFKKACKRNIKVKAMSHEDFQHCFQEMEHVCHCVISSRELF